MWNIISENSNKKFFNTSSHILTSMHCSTARIQTVELQVLSDSCSLVCSDLLEWVIKVGELMRSLLPYLLLASPSLMQVTIDLS